MLSSPFASPYQRTLNHGSLYRDVGMETTLTDASSHQLVAMLFDGWMEAVARARGAIRDRDRVAKGKAIRHAVRIVDEGLRAGLNLQAGGALARDLNDLYSYLNVRLTFANLRDDDDALAECQRLMKPIQEAWAAIADTPAGRR